MVTSTTLTNVNYNCNLRAKELAFDKIKKCVDNVVHGKRGSDAPQRQQIVLQAVFGLDDITTRLKALVLEGQEMGPRAVGIWGKGGAGKRKSEVGCEIDIFFEMVNILKCSIM